jgi:hypothetical protein
MAHGAAAALHARLTGVELVAQVPRLQGVESGSVVEAASVKGEATRGEAVGGAAGEAVDQAPAEVDQELEEPHTEEALAENEQLQSAVRSPPYCDEKVANREIRVWHFVIEKGY